jgi:hypothetical protein
VAENDEVIFSICHIWPRDGIDDVARKSPSWKCYFSHCAISRQ